MSIKKHWDNYINIIRKQNKHVKEESVPYPSPRVQKETTLIAAINVKWRRETSRKEKYMSASINQWQSSSGDTISKCGNKTSATARLRGNSKYLEATSNISSAC